MTYVCSVRECAADAASAEQYSMLLEILRGAHQSANFRWLSKFLNV
jgi:hypothetical protein